MSKKSITSGALTDAISTMLGGLTVAFDKLTKTGIELGKVTEQEIFSQSHLRSKMELSS